MTTKQRDQLDKDYLSASKAVNESIFYDNKNRNAMVEFYVSGIMQERRERKQNWNREFYSFWAGWITGIGLTALLLFI